MIRITILEDNQIVIEKLTSFPSFNKKNEIHESIPSFIILDGLENEEKNEVMMGIEMPEANTVVCKFDEKLSVDFDSKSGRKISISIPLNEK